LFQRHCRRVIEANRLEDLHVRARARGVRSDGRRLVVETDGPTLRTRRLLLAIGLGEQPCWPAWALRLKRAGARIAHVFDPGFERRAWRQASRTVVIGGGITAVQTALQLHAESRGQVHLLSRHALRERQYDFDPCWIGPKCLRAFYRTGFRRRRELIDKARISGSLPIEILETFIRTLNGARLGITEGQCTAAAPTPDGGIRLETSGGPLAADQAVLATGFETRRPGGDFVDRLIRDFRLACNPCGYPIVSPDLRWADRIYATGPLAELQLGPCARNIVGARNAGRLLLTGMGLDSRTLERG
jgi:lysine/ornithine N-monooxygenase